MGSLELRYLTGEKVPVLFKTTVTVSLGKFLVKIPIIVAPVGEDCILGVDFLSEIKILDKVFEEAFREVKNNKEKNRELHSNMESC